MSNESIVEGFDLNKLYTLIDLAKESTIAHAFDLEQDIKEISCTRVAIACKQTSEEKEYGKFCYLFFEGLQSIDFLGKYTLVMWIWSDKELSKDDLSKRLHSHYEGVDDD